MRYTIEKENEVKKLAKEGKSIEYIASVIGIPKKVIWGWCPKLRPHDDVIKQSVKQRYHSLYPDLEAKISCAFSPFINKDITEDQWEDLNKVIYDTLFEESMYVFKNVLTDPPDFGEIKKLSNEPFLDYLKKFWDMDSEYAKGRKQSYMKMHRNSVHYWSPLRNKSVKDITKGDIDIIHENLQSKGLSASRIESVLRTGLIPLRHAYKEGLTILKAYEYQLPQSFRRKGIGIDEYSIVKIFNHSWKSNESFTANLVGYNAEMQLREVRALTLSDIYTEGYINASHIYEYGERKENPNARMIKVSGIIIDCILKYTSTTPYKDFKPEDYVFYSANRESPSSGSSWTKDLKEVSALFLPDTSHIEFSMWS